MIRFFHTYRKTAVGILIVSTAVLAMTGFGVNVLDNVNRREVYAIKVDDDLINHTQFAQERRSVQDRYRQMFGESYQQIAAAVEANLSQQVADQLIASTLIKREARRHDLRVGSDEVEQIMRTQLFSEGFDADMYRAFLRQIGMTSRQFEERLRDDALQAQWVGLLRDVAVPSRREARALIERDETTRTTVHVEFEPAKFEAALKLPGDAELEAWYLERAADYEEPAKAAYDYVVLDPTRFLELVTPTDEDIELHYSDNAERFTEPARFRVRHIQLNYPKDASAEQMAAIKERATEVLGKVKAGESFDALALEYSDDLTSKIAGGDLGWMERGRMGQEFEDAAFALAAGEVSELVGTDYGFHIVKLEEMKEAEPKKLEDVRDQIVREIKEREAPAFTADRAHQLLGEWQKSELKLADFAAKEGLTVAGTSAALGAESDPAPELSGLSRQVIQAGNEERLLVDLPKVTVLVGVREFREPTIPAFAEVREKVVAAWKKGEGRSQAEAAARKLVDDLRNDAASNLEGAAKAAGLKVVTTKEVSKTSGGSGVLANPEILKSVLSTWTPLSDPAGAFTHDGRFVVLQVTSITPPDPKKVEEKLAASLKRAAEQDAEVLVGSIVNRLKAAATIDVDPAILDRG